MAPLEHGTTSPSAKEQEAAGLCWLCFKSPNNPGNRQVPANSSVERGSGLGYSTGLAGRGASVEEHHGSAPCSRFSGAMAISSQKWVKPTWPISWVHPYHFKRVYMCFNNHKHYFSARSVYRSEEQSAYQSQQQTSLRKGCPWLCQTELCTGPGSQCV